MAPWRRFIVVQILPWMKNVGNPLNASDDAMVERISSGD
jgi:hypothetical protein